MHWQSNVYGYAQNVHLHLCFMTFVLMPEVISSLFIMYITIYFNYEPLLLLTEEKLRFSWTLDVPTTHSNLTIFYQFTLDQQPHECVGINNPLLANNNHLE